MNIHESYSFVSETTKCPFAKKAEIIEIPSAYQTIESLAEKLRVELPQLPNNNLDAALVGLPMQYATSLEAVGEGLYKLLDAVDTDCLKGIEAAEWRLKLYGEKYFVGTFWHGFEASNPRKCPEGAFLLFQPKSSFERKFKGPTQETRLRLNIRHQFERDGRPYEHGSLSEAQRFLPGVDWWDNSN